MPLTDFLRWIAGHLQEESPRSRKWQRIMAMARREFAAVLRSIKRWLELTVAALLIVMDSFDQASRALEQKSLRRSIVQKKGRRADRFEVFAIDASRHAHKEMERRCHSKAI
jgi:hypothetical protein